MQELKKKSDGVRFQFIDELRGLSILGVILVHYSGDLVEKISLPLQFLCVNGARGVQLFYLLSGMSIAGSFYRDRNLTRFYLNRFFRIAPMYYLLLMVSLLLKSQLASRIFTVDFLSHITFTNMFFPQYLNSILGVEWSIAIEMVFYAIAPLLLLIEDVNLMILLLFIATGLGNGGATLLRAANSGEEMHLYTALWLPQQIPLFLMGFMYYSIFIKKIKWQLSWWAAFLLAAMVLLGTVGRGFILKGFCYFAITDIHIWGLVFILVTYAFQYKQASSSAMAMLRKALALVGQVSFSIYLVHSMLISRLNLPRLLGSLDPTLQVFLGFILASGATYIVARIFYVFIEKPLIDFGKKFGKKLTAR